MTLAETIEAFEFLTDRQERIEELVRASRRFQQAESPKPFPEANRVPGCESEAFVWVTGDQAAVKLGFAVENPQGVSAMALATILRETMDGLPASDFSSIPDDLHLRLFGAELSMGKALGLGNLVAAVKVGAAGLG
ncbi:MAG: SufE family protein [Fimbriimonadaceae bacterium]